MFKVTSGGDNLKGDDVYQEQKNDSLKEKVAKQAAKIINSLEAKWNSFTSTLEVDDLKGEGDYPKEEDDPVDAKVVKQAAKMEVPSPTPDATPINASSLNSTQATKMEEAPPTEAEQGTVSAITGAVVQQWNEFTRLFD